MSEDISGFVTKYALTTGIAKVALRIDGSGVATELNTRWAVYYHVEGREWHRTLESAVDRAEQMRKGKIASLRKSLAKMEVMTFRVTGL